MKETELGAKVTKWLDSGEWEVYQEVVIRGNNSRPDIVARRGPVLWVIECKTSLSLAVLGQAYEWLPYAHLISVAIPITKRDVGRRFGERVAADYGIGIVKVGDYSSTVRDQPGNFNRKPRLLSHLIGSLREEQKTWAAAGSQGGYYTPFAGTTRTLKLFLQKHPGATMAEILAGIETHYRTVATARICLARLIDANVIRGVRAEKKGKTTCYYLEEKEPYQI